MLKIRIDSLRYNESKLRIWAKMRSRTAVKYENLSTHCYWPQGAARISDWL